MTRRFYSLQEWLAWQETLHPAGIALGLERIRQVFDAMALGTPPSKVVTVAGTNGKGSSVAMLEAIMRAAGYRTGAYFSPHLLRYNERVRICGEQASDEMLCAAFEQVEAARGNIPLTYFEFGTLAALAIFHAAAPDVVLLEVGLGGRLDAVNVLDADVALITSIDVDHSQWLGDDREMIGLEKAGIMRPGRPAVCSDPNPPQSLLMHAQRLGVPLACIGREFDHAADGETWSWRYQGQRRWALPLPVLRGEVQLQNAAGVSMVLEWLKDELPVSQNELREGLLSINLPGRFQVLPGQPQRILDVAHNPHAARALAGVLQRMPRRGRIHAVLAMRSDKDIDGVVAALSETIDVWHVASLDVDQGATCLQLAESVSKTCPTVPVHQYEGPPEAYSHACARAAPTDMIVVLGSFYTVSAVLGLAETRAGDPVYQV